MLQAPGCVAATHFVTLQSTVSAVDCSYCNTIHDSACVERTQTAISASIDARADWGITDLHYIRSIQTVNAIRTIYAFLTRKYGLVTYPQIPGASS